MNTLIRRSLAAGAALAATAALAACSGDDTAGPSPAQTATPPATTVPADPALVGLVGPGCADYVQQVPDGAGSIAGMSNVPLAAAVAKNPQLTMLAQAISGKLNQDVKLVQTLNGGEYTVFAPVDAAFAKLPATTLTQLKSDRDLLTRTLTYHVLTGQLSPAEVAGDQKSVDGADVSVKGSGDSLTVDGAHVICGGIKTANATVYLIDAVLTPAP
jgi:uncharacterized surface protein with fasciclin (FAS1) repeats